MYIRGTEYKKLIECNKVPPEIGGIIAGNNDIVEVVIFDDGIKSYEGIKYIPNTVFINDFISKLYEENMQFMGMFHTHAEQWKTLSSGDIRYINLIMNSMPYEINHLFFPLIFPGNYMKGYVALRNDGKVNIVEEDIEII